MLATRSLTEEQVNAGMMVSLPSETLKGLSAVDVNEVKILVSLTKDASNKAGQAMMATASHLFSIKEIVRKKGWTALCDSGALGMSSKQAQMLALCHERLFLTGTLDSNTVSNVSITTMYLMASADDKKKKEMVAALIEAGGNGFTEKEARAIKNKGKAARKLTVADTVDMGKLTEKIKTMTTPQVATEMAKSIKEARKHQINASMNKRRADRFEEALKAAGIAIPEVSEVDSVEA